MLFTKHLLCVTAITYFLHFVRSWSLVTRQIHTKKIAYRNPQKKTPSYFQTKHRFGRANEIYLGLDIPNCETDKSECNEIHISPDS